MNAHSMDGLKPKNIVASLDVYCVKKFRRFIGVHFFHTIVGKLDVFLPSNRDRKEEK